MPKIGEDFAPSGVENPHKPIITLPVHAHDVVEMAGPGGLVVVRKDQVEEYKATGHTVHTREEGDEENPNTKGQFQAGIHTGTEIGKMTKDELLEYAENNRIEIPQGSTKAEIVAAINKASQPAE